MSETEHTDGESTTERLGYYVYAGQDCAPSKLADEVKEIVEDGLIQTLTVEDGVRGVENHRTRTLTLEWTVTTDNEHLLDELPFDHGYAEGHFDDENGGD